MGLWGVMGLWGPGTLRFRPGAEVVRGSRIPPGDHRGGSSGGDPPKDPRGDRFWGMPRGDLPEGIQRGSPKVLGRIWIDFGVILRRLFSDPASLRFFRAATPFRLTG
jgi:hypothetical protein